MYSAALKPGPLPHSLKKQFKKQTSEHTDLRSAIPKHKISLKTWEDANKRYTLPRNGDRQQILLTGMTYGTGYLFLSTNTALYIRGKKISEKA